MIKNAMNEFLRFFRRSKKSKQTPVSTLACQYLAALTEAKTQAEAAETLHEAICEILQPQQLTLFLHDPARAGYTAQINANDPQLAERFIPEDTALAMNLQEIVEIRNTHPDGNRTLTSVIQDPLNDKSGPTLVYPISGTTRLLGWLALEKGTDAGTFTPQQMDNLNSLTRLFALIYEKIMADRASQNRLCGLTFFEQITADLNQVQDLDEFLTRVFEQMKACFTIDRFSLVLRSRESGQFERHFLIEKNQKIISAHQPLMLGEDFPEARAIKTQKYETVNDNGTWLVAPLLANEQTIGALSFGHNRKDPVFSPSDQKLLYAISNLITAALIHYESQQINAKQTQQLLRLEAINKQLNAPFELDQILQSILTEAAALLNASSGILVAHDANSPEPVVQVTTGPIGSQINAGGLQIREDLSGGYYRTNKSIILNQIDPDRALFRNLRALGPSTIENMISVPIRTQSTNLGFLDLINKNSPAGFTQDDRTILESFAGQAAIAIQKSAQVQISDSDLAEQLEKLSLMQEIDRTLNAARDIDRALQITLESALSQTRAQTGTIGIIEESFEKLENIWQCLPDAAQLTQSPPVVLNQLPWLTKSMTSTQVVEIEDLAQYLGLPEKYGWHYPILSEIGDGRYVLLVLHSDRADLFAPHDTLFLSTLVDHARNALMNALIFEDLHEAIRAKNEFISFISHELKNPLTVIKGYADILRKGMAGNVNEEQIDYLTTIAHNVRRMNTFIKDLSDQSQIETKSLRLDFESTPVFDVVYEVLQTYEAQIAQKHITIKEAIQRPIANMWCDRLRLNQILSNLASNAIKYTAEGGIVEIGAEESTNLWDTDGAAEVVHFWVRDNGYGISQQDQANLFKKFFRGTDPRIQKIPGSGLGLRIAKSLVEMMGGQMWFESTEGQGSTFHFTVPI